MSRVTEVLKGKDRSGTGVADVPTRLSDSGRLLVADGVLPDRNKNGFDTRGVDGLGRFRRVGSEGLLVPERSKGKPFEIVMMTDFGGESSKTDLANAEVELNLRSIGSRFGVELGTVTTVPLEGFSTVNTGFATEQLAHNKDHGDLERVFYINTNPRLDPDDKRSWTDDDNFGKWVYVRLANGSRIFTVNTKYNLSFIPKDEITEAWVLRTESTETESQEKGEKQKRNRQFLSRHDFVVPTMSVLSGSTEYFERPLDIDAISNPPQGDLMAKDGNGNIKTSWRTGNLLTQPGIAQSGSLDVTIGERTHRAINCLDGERADVTTGDLVVQPGSSGYLDTEAPTAAQYAEVVQLYGRAVDVFDIGIIKDNTPVVIRPARERVNLISVFKRIRRKPSVGEEAA
jgi:hypothetical protein